MKDETKTVSKKLKLELKPNLRAAIVSSILSSFMITIPVGFSLSLVINMLVMGAFYSKTRLNAFPPVTLIVAIIAVLLIIIILFQIMNIRSRKYLFYEEEAEFYEGFLNTIHKTVPYSRITDAVLTRSVWDRLFGTGTIYLVTAGMGGLVTSGWGRMGMAGGGFAMTYIENSEEVYKKLKADIIRISK